jgi:hypothetical protein
MRYLFENPALALSILPCYDDATLLPGRARSMKELFSGIYEYQTESSIFDGSNFTRLPMTSTEKANCFLRILQDRTTSIVIATELATNPGMSITNAAEVLASKVIKQFHLNPKTTRFIEHYGKASYDSEEGRKRADTFDEVTFLWTGTVAMQPKWKPLDAKEMKNLLKNSKRKPVN